MKITQETCKFIVESNKAVVRASSPASNRFKVTLCMHPQSTVLLCWCFGWWLNGRNSAPLFNVSLWVSDIYSDQHNIKTTRIWSKWNWSWLQYNVLMENSGINVDVLWPMKLTQALFQAPCKPPWCQQHSVDRKFSGKSHIAGSDLYLRHFEATLLMPLLTTVWQYTFSCLMPMPRRCAMPSGECVCSASMSI